MENILIPSGVIGGQNLPTQGENMLWSGKPRGGIRITSSDISRIASGVSWFIILSLLEYRMVTSKAPLFLIIAVIPFLFICSHTMMCRFVLDALKRSKLSYILTDKRLIIKSDFILKKTISLPIRDIVDVKLRENGDGSGDISIRIWPEARVPEPPDLRMVENADSVYKKIKDILRQKRVN